MDKSNNHNSKNGLYGITKNTREYYSWHQDDTERVDDNGKRQDKGKEKAEIASPLKPSKSITCDSKGKKGTKGNGVSASKKDPEQNYIYEFPVQVFPKWVQEFIDEHKQKKNFPVEYTSAGIMAALSLACGNNRYIEQPYLTKAAIWVVLVGKPGVNKTHPLNAALAPFKEIDEKHFKEYEPLKRAYDKAPEKSKPDEPVLKQLTVNDTTMEALIRVLHNNPDGVLLYKDELASWVKEMDRYRQGGGDMENWNSMFSLQQIRVNRASGNNLYVPKPYVSIAGTIQPRVLKKLSPDGAMIDNGFLDRMLFVWPELEKEAMKINLETVNSDKTYSDNLLNILNGRTQPKRFEITQDSVELLEDWHEGVISRFYGSHETEDGIEGKLRTYSFRFMLLLHMAYHPVDPPTEISTQITEKTILLLIYFENQATKVRSSITGRNPMIGFPEHQRLWYRDLPVEFETKEAKEIAKEHAIPVRTLTELIKKLQHKGLLKKVRHGQYIKL